MPPYTPRSKPGGLVSIKAPAPPAAAPPAAAPAGGLPRLRAAPLGPDPGAAKEALAAAEQPIVSGVLEHLSARMGGLYGLPELNVLIQDTVNGTLKNLRGVVETQVVKTLEAEQFGVVKDMVIRCLTEEVLRVTELSAQALMRRELANLDINQNRLFETLATSEKALQKRLEALEAEQQRLLGGLERLEGGQRGLEGRADELGRGLAKLESCSRAVAAAESRMSSIEAACSSQEQSTQDMKLHLLDVERRCGIRFASAESLEELAQRVASLASAQEERGDEWLRMALEPYALREELSKGIADLEGQVEKQAHRRHQALKESLEGVMGKASATDRSLDATREAHEQLHKSCEIDRVARSELEGKLREEVARLRGEFAPLATVDRSLGEQQEELARMAASIEQAGAKTEAGRQELGEAVAEVHSQLSESKQAVRSAQEGIQRVGLQITRLDEVQAKIQAGFADEKARTKVIMEQQHHNRQEIYFLTEKLGGLSEMGLATGELEARIAGGEEGLAALGGQVAQWKDAVAAQEGLRRDASKLRADLEELRQAVAKVQEEQAQGIQHLRQAHAKWLAKA